MNTLPILLLHGALGSKSQLAPLKLSLEQGGRHVHFLNFSGHGGEPFQSEFGIQVFANDVLIFLDQHNLQQVDIFGYSMGGYVALWLASFHPARIGKIVTLGTKFDWSPESAQKEVKKLNADKIIEKIPAFARILEQRHAPVAWRILMQKTCDMMIELGENPLLTESGLKAIPHQARIYLGDQDDMADRTHSEQVATWLPNGSFKLLESTPHPIEKVNQGILTNLLLR